MASENKYPDLTGFKALSFDCYGTIIDWETGYLSTVRLLTAQLPDSHPLKTEPPLEAMRRLNEVTNAFEHAQPTLPYNEILAESITAFARDDLQLPGLSDSIAEPFGNSPGTWIAFPDSIAALQKLRKYYKLAILSNVDNRNIQATVEQRLTPARFDAVYTAQDIGSYKPSHRNFEYLFEHLRSDLGVDRDKNELLHVARSLTADHVPAKEIGLPSVWISRGGDTAKGRGVGGDYEKLKDKVAFGWRFDTLGDFADEVERQFAAKSGS
ncbi:haloacid dehalogenase [Hypoxylon trugodes]|uniref:haloacid dehalogenase n=1 Tax=Hypoxylon trugodes TaxID=326681 RepID=UPI0021993EFC|nr:haloacid dehalogenase [Hypoxylon trugodes]KAI1392924.1 haloacid dehalogenase [Hypoxylon trugodes]